MRGWVAETAATLAGFLIVRVIAPEAEILNVAVAAAQRRRGIAAALLTEVENTLRKDNVTRLFLEVRESNQPAIAFYKKHGFAVTGARPGYYREPPESAVLMERKLPA
jgi:[ribosomal protein S18]-alanine N-acetyltransferase